jgi:CRP-like cAMP-binding protein
MRAIMADKALDFGLLARSAQLRVARAGETIFKAGDAGKEFYVVAKGEVSIRLGGRVLETVGPNGIFGEMALIDHAPRSADAVAESDVELVALDERQFIYLVSETPFFALNVMRTMARRLRTTTAAH